MSSPLSFLWEPCTDLWAKEKEQASPYSPTGLRQPTINYGEACFWRKPQS